ncbi:MAG: glycosyltransferase [Prevotella sp.]|nr:glycosyltransferase [Prevotella sp.]
MLKTGRFVPDVVRHMWMEYCHRSYIDRQWKIRYGYKVDWQHPRDINECIQWVLCHGDQERMALCSDKYAVRQLLQDKGLGDMLVPLCGRWGKASDIDFDALPEKCVLKCNHDSGSYHFLDKSRPYDKEAIVRDLTEHLRVKYGYVHGELYYNRIEPCILAEQWLVQDEHPFTQSLIDYKVWCFNGKPYCIWTYHNRTRDCVYMNIYDLDWQAHPERLVPTEHYRDGEGVVPRPKNLQQMLDAASMLSEGFPEARVDFYIVRDKIYFGEITFATSCGHIDHVAPEFLREMGKMCNISGR